MANNLELMKKVLLILVIVLGWAATSLPVQAESYQQTNLSRDEAVQAKPQIFGNHIIWLDWQNDADKRWLVDGGSDSRNKMDIFLYDRDAKETRVITKPVSLPVMATLTGEVIVWFDLRPGEPGIYGYKLDGGETELLLSLKNSPTAFDYGRNNLAVYGEEVIYSLGGQKGVYSFNLKEKKPYKIIDSYVNSLSVFGTKVVWTDVRLAGGGIYEYDLVKKSVETVSKINDVAPLADNVQIGEKGIVWLAGDRGSRIIKFYDFATKKINSLSTASRKVLSPRLSSEKIVWLEWREAGKKYSVGSYDLGSQSYGYQDKLGVKALAVEGSLVVAQSTGDEIYLLDLRVNDSALSEILVKEENLVYPVGTLLKSVKPAVYYYGQDGKRHLFPNDQIYFSWYPAFSGITVVAEGELMKIEKGKNITVRPGNVVQKSGTGEIYAMDLNNQVRWVKEGKVLEQIFGNKWRATVVKIPVDFWPDYLPGTDILKKEDFVIKKEETRINY